MNVGSLFSGAGLMDWGLSLAGFEHSWFCERDAYCRRVLELRWPGIPIYEDVRELTDAAPVDLLCGGFPCQPVSLVGRRRAQEDDRWLWPHFQRLIRHLRPRYVLVENVPGLLTAGMGDVLGGLAACGYDAEWDCLPAAAFGAPHIRDRLFILAYPGSARRRQDAGSSPSDEGQDARRRAQDDHVADRDGEGRRAEALADATSRGRERIALSQRPESARRHVADERGAGGVSDADCEPLVWASIARPERHAWPAEPDVGRMAHGVPARVDRLRALGNGVVPVIPRWLGERIAERERMNIHSRCEEGSFSE